VEECKHDRIFLHRLEPKPMRRKRLLVGETDHQDSEVSFFALSVGTPFKGVCAAKLRAYRSRSGLADEFGQEERARLQHLC